MTKTCGIYLFNKHTNQFIIGHVTNTQRAWSIPKGCFDENDVDYFSAAKRELKEETNIDLDELDICIKQSLEPYDYKNKTLIPFLIIINNLPQSIINIRCTTMFIDINGKNQPEIDYFKWITIEEAKNYLPISQKYNLENIRKIIYNIELFS